MKRSGFTLIEILAAVAVIAVLSALILGLAGHAQRTAARKKAEAEIAELQSLVTDYHMKHGRVPKDETAFKEMVVETARTLTLTNLIDPWGSSYHYANPTTNKIVYYLWSTAGETNDSKHVNWIGNPDPSKLKD